MMSYRFYILLAACITCFSFTSSPARSLAKAGENNSIISPAQPCTNNCTKQLLAAKTIEIPNILLDAAKPILKQGSMGPEVSELQTKLKQIGYYDGEVDGQFRESTKVAVSNFQKSEGLGADGVVGITTWERLEAAQAKKTTPTSNPKPSSVAKPSANKRLLWLIVGTVLITGGFGGAIFLFLRAYRKANSDVELEAESELKSQQNQTLHWHSDSNNQTVIQVKPINKDAETFNAQLTAEDRNLLAQNHSSSALTEGNSHPQEIVPLENTTRLPKLDIVEELIKELQSPELAKRRKAVWGLAQQGDSRAVQPLVNMMEHGLNSQEHSLVLEALSQICFRTVKPANKALAVSLQDDNAEVRKNAIRDLTKIYELVAQVTQLLRCATEDEDVEVQQTAHWALSKLSRVRVSSNNESFSKLQNSFNASDSSYS